MFKEIRMFLGGSTLFSYIMVSPILPKCMNQYIQYYLVSYLRYLCNVKVNVYGDKQLQSIEKWEENNPGYMNNTDGQEKYLQFMGNATIDLKDDPKKMNKIIKNVSKEVYITKDEIQ